MADFLLVGGTHPHARAHLKTLQQLPEVERVIVVEPDASVRASYDAEAKVAATVSTLDDGLATGPTHAFTCSRNDRAPADIAACARVGCHVIAEKPLAVSAAAFEPARRAIVESGVTLSIVYQARWHPIPLEARRLIREGVLGAPIAAEARMVTSQVRYRDPSHWLFSRDAAGGGILSWLACHYIDLLAYLLDDEYVSVGAHVGTLGGQAIDVEDVAMLSLRFRRNALATMTAGYLLALSPSGYMRGAYDTYIGIYGREGRLWWDPVGGKTLHVESARPEWASAPRREWTVEVAESRAYGGVYGEEFVRRFLQASAGDGEPPNSLRDGLRVLRVLDAAYESASRGIIAPIEPVPPDR
ncbi:Gfo/Idh/MocA family oxidoreductase [Candidatus Poribacteria bacterium]|nr:Gfo/Idh/MocA family oxidoreductase [Candidatus Poribacteria bacterium]